MKPDLDNLNPIHKLFTAPMIIKTSTMEVANSNRSERGIIPKQICSPFFAING